MLNLASSSPERWLRQIGHHATYVRLAKDLADLFWPLRGEKTRRVRRYVALYN
jgi:hypothetical protein